MKTFEILIWVGLALVVVGGWLVTPALAFFLAGAAIVVLGVALSQEKAVESTEPAEGLDALITASPDVTPSGEPEV